MEAIAKLNNWCRDPNKDLEGKKTTSAYWPIHSSTYREYLELSTVNISMGKGLRAKECVFWSEYLPQLIRKGKTDY